MQAPRKLSIYKVSPHYEEAAINRIDKVFVDGVHLPNCVLYDMDRGLARAKDAKDNWLPMQRGVITVTLKP